MVDELRSAAVESALLCGALDLARTLQKVGSTKELKSTYLAEIQNLVDADGYGIYLLDPTSLHPVDVGATVSDVFLQRYEAEGRQDDPVLAEALITRRPVDSSRLSKRQSWQHSAVFTVLKQAGFYHSLEAPIVAGGQVQGSLAMVRQRGAVPFSEQDLACMGLVADQVAAALLRARWQETADRNVLLLTEALHAISQPIVITNLEGGLIFRNSAADSLAPGSSISFLERALPMVGEALQELRSGAHRIVMTRERLAGSSIGGPKLGSGTGHHDTIDTGGWEPGVFVVKAIRMQMNQNAVISFLFHRPRSPELRMRGVVRLSAREQRIVHLVSQGFTNRQIAQCIYVSENTVKQYLKRIFAKLEVHSRVELVRALWDTLAFDPDGSVSDDNQS